MVKTEKEVTARLKVGRTLWKKVKQIALHEDRVLKDVVSEALTSWCERHDPVNSVKLGKIRAETFKKAGFKILREPGYDRENPWELVVGKDDRAYQLCMGYLRLAHQDARVTEDEDRYGDEMYAYEEESHAEDETDREALRLLRETNEEVYGWSWQVKDAS